MTTRHRRRHAAKLLLTLGLAGLPTFAAAGGRPSVGQPLDGADQPWGDESPGLVRSSF